MNENADNIKNTIDKPHDKALFLALQNIKVAKDAIRAYLPDSLLKFAVLDTIRPYKTKLVTPEFKQFEADIIYEIELTGEDAPLLILLHCEHQSTVEKLLPLRIWQYLLLILMEHAKNHPEKPLPVIYPMVLYTGEAVYNESTDFFDLFGNHKLAAAEHMLKPIKLIDVCQMADDDIKKHKWFGLSEYAFKYKKTKNFEKFLQTMLPWVHEIEMEAGKDYAIMLLKYVIDVYPEANYEQLLEQTRHYLSKELGDEAMTIAQQLEQRGIQQGIQQGMQQGMQQKQHKIAENLLKRGLDLNMISEDTDLDLKELKQMKAKLEETKH